LYSGLYGSGEGGEKEEVKNLFERGRNMVEFQKQLVIALEKLKEHKHQVIYTVLVVVILLLLSRGKQGRYAISSAGRDTVYVLDTKTSRLWQRSARPRENLYFGTNENPIFERISRRIRVKTSEEIGVKFR